MQRIHSKFAIFPISILL